MKTDLLHVYSSDLEESSPLELRQADRTLEKVEFVELVLMTRVAFNATDLDTEF